MRFETVWIHKLGIRWHGSCGDPPEYEFYWAESREGLAGKIARRLLKCDVEWRVKIKERARYAIAKALVIPKTFCPERFKARQAHKFLDLGLLWDFAYPMEDLWDSESEQVYVTFNEDSVQAGYEFVDEVLQSDAFAALCGEDKKQKEAARANKEAERERAAKVSRRTQYEKLKKEFGDG